MTLYQKNILSITSNIKNTQKKDLSYNDKNNITPKTILKSIDQISLSTSVADQRADEMIKISDSEELNINFENIDKIEVDDVIKTLDRKMKKAAENMKFEIAAMYRDKINEISEGEKK